MTYPRAILRFALLTVLLGAVTEVQAGERTDVANSQGPGASAKRTMAKAGGKRKGGKPPASAESKEPAATAEDEGKPAEAAAESDGKAASPPSEGEGKAASAPTEGESKAAEANAAAEAEEAQAPAKVERKEPKAPAREPTADERKEAKEHAARGLYLFQHGAYKGALAELERAYELVGSRLLLFRIASVHAAMGNPVEAVENLDELLADQGPLKPEYLEKARALKEEQQQQIGQLDVKVNVPATIEVDGTKVGRAPLDKSIPVKAGQHMISIVADGHMPQRQTVSVAGSGTAEVAVELKPIEGRLAYVKVYSSVPAVEVLLDDVSMGKTPLAEALAVEPGKHVVELQRPGYMNQRRELKLADGARATVAFDGEEDRTADDERGRLVLTDATGEVRVTIDRRQRGVYRKPIGLPQGPHVVKLEQDDFEPMETTVEVPRGGEAEVKVALRSKGVREAAVTAKAHTYRNWAIASLVSGVVLAGGGTGIAVWQNGKIPGAEDNLAQTRRDNEAAGCNDPNVPSIRLKTCQQAIAKAQSDLDGYRNNRLYYGIIPAAVGVGLIGVGIALLVMAPDAPATGEEETAVSWWMPVVSAGPGGASLLLQGRF